jgi:hypothetical protein
MVANKDPLKFQRVKPGEWLISVSQEPDVRKIMAKRHHDLIGSLRTLKFAVEALRRGYRFDDESGEAKLVAMERAVLHLEREGAVLEKLFLTESD